MTSHPQHTYEPPSGACQIALVRHGQSIPYVEGNPFPLVDGQGDPPLSPRGEWQALQVGERLRDEPIDAIYVTSLQRTHQTAAPLASHLGITPTVEPDLREIHMGDWEGGIFRQKLSEGHPAVAELRRTGEWASLPGAESSDALRTRTVAAIERIAQRHPDQFVTVVCHGGVISMLLSHAAGVQSPRTFPNVRNGSVSHIVVGRHGWTIRLFNDAAHTGTLTTDHDA